MAAVAATQPDDAPGSPLPGADGGASVTTTPPFTPATPLWIWAAVAPARLSATMAKQTNVVVGNRIVAEPMASRSPFRQSGPLGGATALHSLPPFSTAKSGAPMGDCACATDAKPPAPSAIMTASAKG